MTTTSVIAVGKYISPLKQTLFIPVESEVHLRIFGNGLHLGESLGSSKTAWLFMLADLREPSQVEESKGFTIFLFTKQSKIVF